MADLTRAIEAMISELPLGANRNEMRAQSVRPSNPLVRVQEVWVLVTEARFAFFHDGIIAHG